MDMSNRYKLLIQSCFSGQDELNDQNNYYMFIGKDVIGTYSIVVIIWSYLDFDITF